MTGNDRTCRICGASYGELTTETAYSVAGEWLSEEHWKDKGELCPQCLENRAKLAMMYLVDR